MVSNGAFVLKEWVQGSYMLALRNHYYWNDAATRLDGVKYLLIPDENAELARYRGGELQVTFVVPRGQFDWIKANLDDQLHVAPQLTTYYYGFNLRRAPFRDNPKLRRALSLVIDREKLESSCCASGSCRPTAGCRRGSTTTPHSPSTIATSPWRRASPRRSACTRRPATRARGRSSFELRYNSGEVHTKLAVAIASMWKEALGVDVRLTQVEFKSLLQDIDRGDVEVFRSSWVGDYNDAYSFLQYLKSDFGVNLPHYRSAEVRRAARARGDGSRCLTTPRAAGRGRARDARTITRCMPMYFYVNKHLVKPRGRRLVRQRHERGLQQGLRPARRDALSSCADDPRAAEWPRPLR